MLVPAPALRFFVCLLALLPFSFAAHAQEPTATPGPLQMALASPFALTAKPLQLTARRGKWFPVAVTLSNTGDPVNGTLRLHLVASGEFDNEPNEVYCPVDMPANSRKVIWLYGRMDRPGASGVEISFSGRGFPALSERVPIQEPEDGQRVVLTISDNVTGLSDTFKSLRGPGLSLSGSANPTGFNPSGSQSPLRSLETPRAGVPDRWFGLECADLVVLGDFAHSALLPPQIEALRGFVAGGGTLLALGGSNAARLRTSPLADLWPGQIGDSGTASAGEVAGIVRRYIEVARNGADRLGGAPVVVARTSLRAGAQLRAGTAAAPLFSFYDVGAGRVLFLGFDPSQPPFNGWSGQNGLWRDVFGATMPRHRLDGVDYDYVGFGNGQSYPGNYQPNYTQNYNPNYDQPQSTTGTGMLLNALAKAPQLSMPPVTQIAWFLSLYVFVLVPLNYAILRFIDRRELAWITIPVIVAAFSAFAYAAALSIRGNAILTRQVDVVQTTLGSKVARTDSLLWLFSPKRTTYDITSASPNAGVADFANDAGGKQGAFSILQPADVSPFKVENANVWMWTDRAFSSQSLADLKSGITLKNGQVQNGTPFELRGAVWVQDHEISRLGTIESGGSASIPVKSQMQVFSTEMAGAILNIAGVDSIFDTKTVSNGIPSRALSAALGSDFGRQNEGTLLVAWAKKPVAPLQIGTGGARSSDLTLVVIRVPSGITGRVASREAVVRRVGYEPAPAPASPIPGRVTPNFMQSGTEFYECQLTRGAAWKIDIRGTGARGNASGSSLPFGIIGFEAWNTAQNRWVTLSGNSKNDNSPAGGWNFSAQITSDFPRQPDRMLRLRVRRSNRVLISNVRVTST